MRPVLSFPRLAVSSSASVLAVTVLCHAFLPVNPTTVALSYTICDRAHREPVAASSTSTAAAVTATVCLNVFFLPPVGRVTIADPQNWIALGAFLITGIVASQLSGRARSRTMETLARQRDLERLYALSRGLLLSSGRPSVPAAIASQIADSFGFGQVGVFDCGTDASAWTDPAAALDGRLREAAQRGVAAREAAVVLVPVQMGGTTIGSLAIPETGLGETVLQMRSRTSSPSGSNGRTAWRCRPGPRSRSTAGSCARPCSTRSRTSSRRR